MAAQHKKYHFVYKITNSINGKYYIGVHSTNVIEDGYMGSGSLLRRDIKEHGINNFEREILHHFETRHEALQKEMEIVNFDFLRDEMTYNLVIGGAMGVRTVKEKAIHFAPAKVRDIVYKTTDKPYERYNESIYYKLIPRQPGKIKNPTKFQKQIEEILTRMIPDVMISIEQMYNNKYTHASIKKLLDKYPHSHDIVELSWDCTYQITTKFDGKIETFKYITSYPVQKVAA